MLLLGGAVCFYSPVFYLWVIAAAGQMGKLDFWKVVVNTLVAKANSGSPHLQEGYRADSLNATARAKVKLPERVFRLLHVAVSSSPSSAFPL